MLKVTSLALAALLSAASLLAGDLTITYATKGKGMSGSQIHYYGANLNRTNDAGARTDTLVDFNKGMMYTIKHKDQKIEYMSFDDLGAMMDAVNKPMEGQDNPMAGLMSGMFGDPDKYSVDELGKDTVAGRACNKYKVTVGKLVMEESLDPTLKPPTSPAALARAMKLRGVVMGRGPVGKTFVRLYEELAKLKGLPLRTHMSGFMGMDVTTEATEVKQGDIPASVFALPPYKMEDMGKKMRAELAKQH